MARMFQSRGLSRRRRKVFFRSARYRIVYRLEPNQITPKRVNVSSTRRETA
jgi:hypothetical protein